MSEHVCRCYRCAGDEWPPETRQFERANEGHIRATLGDWKSIAAIWINGERSTRCWEAMLGQDGWAITDTGAWHLCRNCGLAGCGILVRGHVVAELVNEAH